MRLARLVLVILVIALVSSSAVSQQKIQSPSEFLGLQVGADRQLADYHQIVSYFRMLEKSSDRLQIENLGPTTMGNDLIMAVISSPKNLKNRTKYQEIARKLANPGTLSKAEIDALIEEGKVIVLVSGNIHSTEIGASQMFMEWAHDLVTAQDAETRKRLEGAILLVIPSLNPDGQLMEVEWYRKYVGTKYEGGDMPWLYHQYIGHDNNRDWYMLTQKETKAVNHAIYREWYPQIWLDEHQMGSSGPRIFVPPYAEPGATNVPALMWRGVNQIGTLMAWRLEEQRKSGVIYNYAYDAYWPGATEGTAWWKNTFGLLTEMASARMATPTEIHPSELRGNRKGLIDYAAQTNYPNPWPGGVWRLRDIMDYERIVSDALLETAVTFKRDYMRGVASMASDSTAAAKPDEYYRISSQQGDPARAARLAHLFREHGAEVEVANNGDFLVPIAQPLGRFLTELVTKHRYPKVRPAAGTNIIAPYDVTTWSLPLMMGVDVARISLAPGEIKALRAATDNDWPVGGLSAPKAAFYAVDHRPNDVSRLINSALKQKMTVFVAQGGFISGADKFDTGTVVIEPAAGLEELAKQYHLKLRALPAKPSAKLSRIGNVRVGLYKPYTGSIDEGWTRWLLEQYSFDVKSLENKAIASGNLRDSFDAIILPDEQKELIVEGKPKREEGEMRYFEELPPEYEGGIGKDGVKALKEFVEKGGTLITLGVSGDLVIDEFNVPVRNVLAKVRAEDFLCPGSLLRVRLDTNHPVNYGMPQDAVLFQDEEIAYQTALSGPAVERNLLAWYPNEAEDILISGWIRGAERLQRLAAAVAITQGKGRVVLLGFRPQHRAQTESTFKMLFNSIQWAGMTSDRATVR